MSHTAPHNPFYVKDKNIEYQNVVDISKCTKNSGHSCAHILKLASRH